MEFKVIVYIVLGVGYFLYSAYKKVNEEKEQAPKPKRINAPTTSTQPKPKSWLDETIEKMQQEADKAKQQTASPQKIKTQKQRPLAKRDLIVHEVKRDSAFEEGTSGEAVYERPLTSEEILHNERMRAAQSVEIEVIEEETSIHINPREAFIGSVIFERKF